MDYEKKYKEAQKWIESIYSELSHEQQMEAEAFFPELKESEDERIRKEIIATIHLYYGEPLEDEAKEMIAWLEKQEGCEYIKKDWLEHIKQSWYKEGFIDGKYSGGTSKEWTINDAAIFKEIIDFLENGTAKLQHDLTRYANWLKIQFTPIEKQGGQKSIDNLTQQEAMDIAVAKCFNEGEQKPANKVEPKFHEGEWITNGDYTWKIVEVKPLDYILQSQEGNIVDDTISHVDEQFHSFTIKDAKDGDMLASNRSIFIFSQEYIAGKPEAHCGIMNGLFLVKPEGCWTNEECYPATKEQRDTLFAKMKEAGYEWNADKKELKKIEQKPQRMISAEAKEAMYDKPTDNDMVEALRTEYEKGRADAIAEMQKHNDAIKPKFNIGDYIVSNSGLKYYITGIFKGYYMTESGCIITLDAQDNYKVYNNFWSKEEEELLNNICNLLQNPDSIKANQHVIGNIVDWLKSIKNRVLPQPKQEWSEEDAVNFNLVYTYVPDDSLRDWLKELKERYTWKPSDAQMGALLSKLPAIKGSGYEIQCVLETLYDDLKKLKGE